MTENTVFFLGANSPEGFHSLFSELYDPRDGWRAFILKGGPGTGKSTFLRTVAQACGAAGVAYETIPCASDPQSLDAVRIESKKICIADGTAPHVIEPQYPGAVETTLELGAFRDDDTLRRSREEILRLFADNAAQHRRCVRFLQAAHSLDRDVRRLALDCVDEEKIRRYASRLAARRFGKPRGTIGRETRRFLSAVTPDGITALRETPEALCDDILVVEDAHGAASAALIGEVRRYALGAGLDVISCPCFLYPDAGPQHLILPQIRFALLTETPYLHFAGTQRIRASRFTDTGRLRAHRSRITFSRRTEKELLEEAVCAMQDALQIHNALEAYYKPCMDFAAVQRLAEQTAAQILA